MQLGSNTTKFYETNVMDLSPCQNYPNFRHTAVSVTLLHCYSFQQEIHYSTSAFFTEKKTRFILGNKPIAECHFFFYSTRFFSPYSVD